MNNEDIYKTKDLGVAAALIAKKLKLKKINRFGKVCWFVFNNKEACLYFVNKYYYGRLPINARGLYEILRRLKNLIFAESYENNK